MKAILMSIRPQHLVNILNGKKTIELRKRLPSDYRGWVYCYCTKTKPYITQQSKSQFTIRETKDFTNLINGKVVCRFWVDNVEEIDTNLGHPSIYVKACVQDQEAIEYGKGKMVKVISISKLEIFDKPKKLGEFYYYKKRLIDCGRDCPPYVDEVKTQVRKAPQSWQYIYIEEDK